MLPDPQTELTFTGNVAATTPTAEAARAFIAYQTSQDAVAVIKAMGLSPG